MASRVLALLLCGAVPLQTGCGGDDDLPDAAADAGDDAPMDAGRDAPARMDTGPDPLPEIPSRVTDTEADEGRAGCAFEAGAMPWETVGESFPIGDEMPFDHIILLLQENRSFDHYFGMMPGVEGIPEGASNPDTDGTPVEPFHTDVLCIEDVTHNWTRSHEQYAGGLMNGFVTTNAPDGARALGILTDADIPYYWELYQTFAMSDHHHCSMLGPTWPNRYFYTSGTSFGRIRNTTIEESGFAADAEYVIFQQLEARGINWRMYQSDVPTPLGLYPRYAGRRLSRIKPIDQFFTDLAAGDLPPIVYLEPQFFQGVEQSDEHPPANPQFGQAFVHQVVSALMDSPIWERSAFVLTYDEHGGFYDHVVPPAACPPDATAPELTPSDAAGGFDQLGFRVPLVVVSPYAKAGYVSDRVTDLTSVLRLVQTRWLLPALTARDANAWPLLDMFDFDAPPFMDPPTLTAATIDETRAAACREAFPDRGFP